jgi:hypothetical protein
MQKVLLIGNLGRDPEVKCSQQGMAIAQFSVATTERWKDKGGEPQEHTEWFAVKAFGHVDVCAHGRGWHQTTLLVSHLGKSGRRPTASDAPNLAQNLWAPFLVLFAGCPNILGIGVPPRRQPLREVRHFAPRQAAPSKPAPHNPCSGQKRRLVDRSEPA